MSSHEDFSRTVEVHRTSDRMFGLVFAVFSAVIGLWPIHAGRPVQKWALAVSGGLAAVSLVGPSLLTPFNRLWTGIGSLLNTLVSPIVTGLLFYLVFVPAGFLLRLDGKDRLLLRFDPNAPSYWISREPPGPAPKTMSNGF